MIDNSGSRLTSRIPAVLALRDNYSQLTSPPCLSKIRRDTVGVRHDELSLASSLTAPFSRSALGLKFDHALDAGNLMAKLPHPKCRRERPARARFDTVTDHVGTDAFVRQAEPTSTEFPSLWAGPQVRCGSGSRLDGEHPAHPFAQTRKDGAARARG